MTFRNATFRKTLNLSLALIKTPTQTRFIIPALPLILTLNQTITPLKNVAFARNRFIKVAKSRIANSLVTDFTR